MSASPDPAALRSEAATTWDVPSLDRIPIVSSSRLRRSLGLFDARKVEVRVASFMDGAAPALYREVVLHELAHAAVHLIHGQGLRPHGPEWRGFMESAGLSPRVRLPREELAELLPDTTAGRGRRVRWEHRCPVCQASRVAGRPVPRWRCSSCVSAGLVGKLIITRIPLRSQGASR